ncbi:MAG: Asp-tRNA(Asn)/Glu-tRNA(Gln) amidotransferase subunit GatB [Candidatus Omnitrophica bacterium]|nr:Asp-tRNA(Asn)/Glu-tRNA(Gln) amidotransferase subunit GatB [Candidatus Omnitrophota bacterium]MCF7917253.1 Asp-tRNA(Asn)/Glu-tRNA(Gln) amidotransferase subunit GatB [Candidatus Omnitrophota bacterium]
MNKEFNTTIGLEVHVQLSTKSKIFCSCSTKFGLPPNTNICPICSGFPGVLPVFNREALRLGLRAAVALNCKINPIIYFERKNYFYPDLPKNYQISQYKSPLGYQGGLTIDPGKRINIERVHLEEDAGKLIHKKGYSLVDFNRTGVPLLEIVSCPDMSGPQEAFDYLYSLKLILQYIGVSTCDMEKGYLRCDANISVKEKGASTFGTKVELKNMNSFKGVKAGLEYEVKRQIEQLKSEKKVIQETRLWDADNLKTVIMRSKEEACDYRYFPEPDLPDFKVQRELIEREKDSLEELPDKRRERFIKEYGFSKKESSLLIENKDLADFFEAASNFYNQPKKIHKLLFGPFLEQVKLLKEGLSSVKISAGDFAKVVKYFDQKKINNLGVKKALALAIAGKKDIDRIIEAEGLVQISDEKGIEEVAEKVLAANLKAAQEYKQGKTQAIKFLIGQVMKETRGRANPQLVKKILERGLKE